MCRQEGHHVSRSSDRFGFWEAVRDRDFHVRRLEEERTVLLACGYSERELALIRWGGVQEPWFMEYAPRRLVSG